MKITPGKLAGLRAVSDARGVIAAAAMDQRGSLQKPLSAERGSAISAADLSEFKSLVTEVLTRNASAILLDPEFGLAAAQCRQNAGLLLAYEKTGYDAATPGRLPDLLDVRSVRRLKQGGADCIKILLYYTPYEWPEVDERKHAWIERVGDECRANDIDNFLEFAGYDAEGGNDKSVQYAKRKASIVAGSMAEFGKSRYGVDVLKVEVPVEMSFVQGTSAFKGEAAYTRSEALEFFRAAEAATDKLFIYLSAGVSNPVFIETLELAAESGTKFNGVLCGRATWKDGISVYAKHGAGRFRLAGVDWVREYLERE